MPWGPSGDAFQAALHLSTDYLSRFDLSIPLPAAPACT
jgi:hypothetical protein